MAAFHVKNAVLLHDRSSHGLDDDAWSRVVDGRGLLVQLLGEKVDTEVSLLSSGGRAGDADDLARSALQNQDVADADVVARDGDGALSHLGLVTFMVKKTVSHLVHAVAERMAVFCACGVMRKHKGKV